MISKDKVVSMHYTLKDDEGNVIDASEGTPLEFLYGHGNIIPGLESALKGLKAGDRTKVEVAPADGYGEFDPERVVSLGRDQFGPELPPIDAVVELRSDDGDVLVGRVSKITDTEVVFDANHPLAGKRLHFDVHIAEVRDASAEELEHGHAHGAGGHHDHDHDHDHCSHDHSDCCKDHDHHEGGCCDHDHHDHAPKRSSCGHDHSNCCKDHNHHEGGCCDHDHH